MRQCYDTVDAPQWLSYPFRFLDASCFPSSKTSPSPLTNYHCNMSIPLILEDAKVTSVHVHPVVTFTILDHFIRRTEDQYRVIGVSLTSPHLYISAMPETPPRGAASLHFSHRYPTFPLLSPPPGGGHLNFTPSSMLSL